MKLRTLVPVGLSLGLLLPGRAGFANEVAHAAHAVQNEPPPAGAAPAHGAIPVVADFPVSSLALDQPAPPPHAGAADPGAVGAAPGMKHASAAQGPAGHGEAAAAGHGASPAARGHGHGGGAPWYQRISIHGFADFYYAYNFNRPEDGNNFLPGVGVAGKRANEMGLNLTSLEIALEPEPVGARVVLNYGHAIGVLDGPGPARVVSEASVSLRVPIGRGLLISGGILPSHVGFEAFATYENWNYTRSYVRDFAPAFDTGLRLAYGFTEHLSAQLLVFNGWEHAGEENAGKTLGAQLQWSSDLVQATYNLLAGPELRSETAHWRVLNDLFLVMKPLSRLHVALVADLGLQQYPTKATALWYGAALYLRALPHPKLTLAARGGVFGDPDSAISGASQIIGEGTGTVDFRPAENYVLRLEGRYDRSTASVFGGSHLYADGTPVKVQGQALLLLSAVASF